MPETFLGPAVEAVDASGRFLLLVMAGRIQAEHCRFLLNDSGLAVEVCRSVAAALARLENRAYDAVILDWNTLQVEFLGRDWREAWTRLAWAARRGGARTAGIVVLFDSDAPVLPEIEEVGAITVAQSGAIDGKILSKVVDLAVSRGAETAPPTLPNPPAVAVETGLVDFLIGRSAAIRRVTEQLRLVAPKDTTVLITGETGTGKERVSRAIHLLSRRRKMEMVSVNCGGIPATLLEDEFFGHVKGAFTDARQSRVGRFEQAHGSTIFLDEIGDLPLELQPKLLRVLQEREIHRIGGVEAIHLDVRVIAATNVDLWRRVEQGRFREDLFYRINVFHLHLPPLRERREDIPLFVSHFLDRICSRDRLPAKRLGPDAAATLLKRPWRGNIRQLENAVEIAAIRAQDRCELTAEDFPHSRDSASGDGRDPGAPSGEDHVDFKTLVTRFERDLIASTLERTQGNKNKAAQVLGLKRTTLIEKMKRFGL